METCFTQNEHRTQYFEAMHVSAEKSVRFYGSGGSRRSTDVRGCWAKELTLRRGLHLVRADVAGVKKLKTHFLPTMQHEQIEKREAHERNETARNRSCLIPKTRKQQPAPIAAWKNQRIGKMQETPRARSRFDATDRRTGGARRR